MPFPVSSDRVNAVRVVDLAKAYGHYRVFEGISFELKAGECLAIFGPNGAGKTSLIRVLATLARPSEGRFEIAGCDGTRDPDGVRSAMLLLAHGSHLYDELNGAENIRFSLAMRNLAVTDNDIKLALDRVGIGAFADLKTRYYSAGMKKRLTLAKSMLIRPKVLLLDEPYTSLDERGVSLVNEYLRELSQAGSAVLMTTHDRARSAEVVQRAAVLNQGRMREVPVAQLTQHALF